MLRYVNTKEELSEDHLLDDPTVVVFDVCMFSSTVISIFDQGVDYVGAYNEKKEIDYKFGGEGEGEFDFGNYPQSVYGNITGTEEFVGIISDNGSVACHNVKNINENCDIIIGSTINIGRVVDYIRQNDEQEYVLLQSGRRGNYQFEDSVASAIVSERIRGTELQKKDMYKNTITRFIREYYDWVPEEDIERIINFDSYDVLPISSYSDDEHICFKDISSKI